MNPLIEKATKKTGQPFQKLLMDAFLYQEICHSKEQIVNIVHEFVEHDNIPVFLEDYCLDLISGKAIPRVAA